MLDTRDRAELLLRGLPKISVLRVQDVWRAPSPLLSTDQLDIRAQIQSYPRLAERPEVAHHSEGVHPPRNRK